jgi:hypothetical protein
MKKSFLVTGGLVLMIAASLAFMGHEEPRYKNLKVLPKNITREQMDSVMHHFTASLNVKCNFCHVRTADNKEWNFAADDNKHKLIARDMMRMTDKINDKYFDLTGSKRTLSTPLMVTCYTCHNGRKEPLTKAPVVAQTPRAKADTAKKG